MKQYFRGITLRSIIKNENNKYEVTFDINWYKEWGSVGRIVNSYKHMNILGVDLDIFIRGLDIIERGFNIIGGLFQKVN